MSLVLNSSGGGSVTLQEPVTATNGVINLPDSGTLITQSTNLLGTLNTTSGTSHTLSGLVLTGYAQLNIVMNGVSLSSNSSIRLANVDITELMGTSLALGFTGHCFVDLISGTFSSIFALIALTGNASNSASFGRAGRLGITNATTSLTFSNATFDAGTITVYGVR